MATPEARLTTRIYDGPTRDHIRDVCKDANRPDLAALVRGAHFPLALPQARQITGLVQDSDPIWEHRDAALTALENILSALEDEQQRLNKQEEMRQVGVTQWMSEHGPEAALEVLGYDISERTHVRHGEVYAAARKAGIPSKV